MPSILIVLAISYIALGLPILQVSEILKNILTSIAIVAGAAWAIYQWVYEVRAHGPSLDGDLAIESTDLKNEGGNTDAIDLLVVSVRAKWINRSKSALRLDTKKCMVYVFKVFKVEASKDISEGKLVMQKPQSFLDQCAFPQCDFPERNEEVVLEPKAESVFRVHFILKKGPVYLFRWELESITKKCWDKEIVWNSTGETHKNLGKASSAT